MSWGEFRTRCAHYAPGDREGGWALPQRRHGRGQGVGASVQDPGTGRVSRALETAGGPKSVGSRPAPLPGFGEGGQGATLGSALSSPSSDPQPALTPAPRLPSHSIPVAQARLGDPLSPSLASRAPECPCCLLSVVSGWTWAQLSGEGVSRVLGEGRWGQSGCGASPPLLIPQWMPPGVLLAPQEMDDTLLALAAGP